MANLPVRDRSDAKLAGVCSALARAWSVDPLIVRVAFVVLALMTNGFMVAAYFALWALLPERGGEPPVQRIFPATRSWSWGTMLTVVIIVAATVGGIVSGSGPGAFVVLALAWVILRFGTARRAGAADAPLPPAPPPPPATPFERYASAWQQRLANLEAGRPADWAPAASSHPDPAGLYGPTSPYDQPAPRASGGGPARRRRGRRTWLGVLVGLGTLWAALAGASALGLIVPPLAWASGTLAVLGLGLLWSARAARAAWGRPALLLPAAILAGLASVGLLFDAQSPERPAVALLEQAPGTVQQLPVGEHTLDLASRPVATETLSYRLDLGDLVVVAPRDGNVVVRARAVAGEVRTPGGSAEGVDVYREWRRVGDPAAPTLTIDVSVGLGEVEVRP